MSSIILITFSKPLSQSNYLLLFCSHQLFASCNCCFFHFSGVCKARSHFVTHLFQNSDNLTTLRRIISSLGVGQKCHQILTIIIVEVLALGGKVLQKLCSTVCKNAPAMPFSN